MSASAQSVDVGVSARNILREYAARRWPTLNHKGRISRLAGTLNWTHRRVRTVYQNEPGARLRANEMADAEALENEANRDQFQILQDRVARLEAALLHQDEAFHHEQVAGFRHAVDGGRGNHVSSAVGEDTDRWSGISD